MNKMHSDTNQNSEEKFRFFPRKRYKKSEVYRGALKVLKSICHNLTSLKIIFFYLFKVRSTHINIKDALPVDKSNKNLKQIFIVIS